MKKLIISLLLIFGSIISFAQNYEIGGTKYYISYCNSCTGASGWYMQDDTIFISTTALSLQGWDTTDILKRISDSLATITGSTDSIYFYYTTTNGTSGWRGINDTVKIKTNYVTTESDPIYTVDSANLAKKTYVNQAISDSINTIQIPDSTWLSITATNANIDTIVGPTVVTTKLNLPYLNNSSTRSLIVKANGDVDSITQTDINTYLGTNIITSATITTLSTSRIPNTVSYINADSVHIDRLYGINDGEIPLQTNIGVVGQDTANINYYQAQKYNAQALYITDNIDSLTIKNNGVDKFIFDSDGDTIEFQDNVKIAGQVTWQLPLSIAYYGDTTTGYTPSVTKLAYTKITPTFTNVESDYITFQGDSLIITKAGDYEINLCYVLTAGTNDRFRMSVFKNKNTTGIYNGVVISGGGTGVYVDGSWNWYLKGLSVGDYLDFRITNAIDSDDPTFWRLKFIIKKFAE